MAPVAYSPLKAAGASVQEELARLQQKVDFLELNTIEIEAALQARVQAAESRCRALIEAPRQDVHLRRSTALKAVLGAGAAWYLQKALASKPVSKLGYTQAMRHLHLLIAVGTFGSVASVRMAVRAEGAEKRRWLDLHKVTGVVLFVAFGLRVLVRLRSPIPERFPGPLRRAETLSHYLYYLLMLGLPSSGLAYTYLNGSGMPLLGLSKESPEEEDMERATKALGIHRALGRLLERAWTPFHLGSLAAHSLKGRSVVRRITPFP